MALRLRSFMLPNLGIVIASSLATTLALFTIFKLHTPGQKIIPSPLKTQIQNLSKEERDELPYPPDLLPGGRDVTSPVRHLTILFAFQIELMEVSSTAQQKSMNGALRMDGKLYSSTVLVRHV